MDLYWNSSGLYLALSFPRFSNRNLDLLDRLLLCAKVFKTSVGIRVETLRKSHWEACGFSSELTKFFFQVQIVALGKGFLAAHSVCWKGLVPGCTRGTFRSPVAELQVHLGADDSPCEKWAPFWCTPSPRVSNEEKKSMGNRWLCMTLLRKLCFNTGRWVLDTQKLRLHWDTCFAFASQSNPVEMFVKVHRLGAWHWWKTRTD